MTNQIRGSYTEAEWYGPVTFDGKVLDPTRSQHLRNHSPDGFSWGYPGSGPSQLALAILLEAGCSDDQAMEHYHEFKRLFIATADQDGPLSIDVDVMAWVRLQGAR